MFIYMYICIVEYICIYYSKIYTAFSCYFIFDICELTCFTHLSDAIAIICGEFETPAEGIPPPTVLAIA